MEELEEQDLTIIDLFAAVALIGVQSRGSFLETPELVARKSFDIAEAMYNERKRRMNNSNEQSCTQE
jgi:hypothetical protein